MIQTLLYLTHIFPFPGDSFPNDELPILSHQGWQIIVIPCGQYHGTKSPLPLPAHVRCDFRLLGHPLTKLLRILTPTGIRLLWEEWRYRHKHGMSFFWIGAIKACASAAFVRQKLRQLILGQHLDKSPLVIYSFWFSHHAMAIPLLRREFHQLRYVSRAHGIDLYTERHPYGHLPFYGLRSLVPDMLAPCSLHGIKALLKEGVPLERLSIAYLGAPAGPTSPCPPSPEGEVALVSCSGMVPVKRLLFLVSLLAELARKRPHLHISWHHLGDGPDASTVRMAIEQQLQLLPNITPILHGQLSPDDVRAFFAGTRCPLDALINVSKSEGLPVSMMEALAAGLPLIGTNVGGVAEIITPETGILLPVNCDGETFIKAVDAVASWKKKEKRQYNQIIFKKHFQLDINYTLFAKKIIYKQFLISLSTINQIKKINIH